MSAQAERSDSLGVEIEVSRVTNLDVRLTDAGGCRDGINLCVNDGDDYTISSAGAQLLAAALQLAAEAHREQLTRAPKHGAGPPGPEPIPSTRA